MLSYFVLLHSFNQNKSEKYDIMPYLINTYKECEEKKHWWMFDDPKIAPIAKEDFKYFVEQVCKHMYWARCEYEWLMLGWPPGKTDTFEDCQKIINSAEKIGAWDQIEMNLDVVVATFLANIKAP